MKIKFTGTDELLDLQSDLARAAAIAPVTARAIVKKGAQNIKTDAQRTVSGLAHAPSYPRAITYDTHETPMGGWAEIGPDKDRRQGALGNILEYGTVNNAPTPHLAPAATAEEPRTARALEAAAIQSLERPWR